MKININMTVEVDPEEWNVEYGSGTKPTQVREDVKGYCLSLVNDSVAPMSVVRMSK